MSLSDELKSLETVNFRFSMADLLKCNNLQGCFAGVKLKLAVTAWRTKFRRQKVTGTFFVDSY
jgi:hypothetical protein